MQVLICTLPNEQPDTISLASSVRCFKLCYVRLSLKTNCFDRSTGKALGGGVGQAKVNDGVHFAGQRFRLQTSGWVSDLEMTKQPAPEKARAAKA